MGRPSDYALIMKTAPNAKTGCRSKSRLSDFTITNGHPLGEIHRLVLDFLGIVTRHWRNFATGGPQGSVGGPGVELFAGLYCSQRRVKAKEEVAESKFDDPLLGPNNPLESVIYIVPKSLERLVAGQQVGGSKTLAQLYHFLLQTGVT